MTPEIVAESERRERLRCVGCGCLPPESVVRAWAVALRWACGECLWPRWPLVYLSGPRKDAPCSGSD